MEPLSATDKKQSGVIAIRLNNQVIADVADLAARDGCSFELAANQVFMLGVPAYKRLVEACAVESGIRSTPL